MSSFYHKKSMLYKELGKGISRRILGYETDLLLARVHFDKGAVGEVHAHPHQQVSYIEQGRFEVEIGEEKQILVAGDCFSIPANTDHGVVALEEGILIDAFSPAREDFLNHD